MNEDHLIKKIEKSGQKHFFSLTPKVQAAHIYSRIQPKKPLLKQWQAWVYPAALGFSFLAILIRSTQPSSIVDHSFQVMTPLNSLAYPPLEKRDELGFEDGLGDVSLFKDVSNSLHAELTPLIASQSNVLWSPVAVTSIVASLMTMVEDPSLQMMLGTFEIEDDQRFLNQHTSMVIDLYRQLLNNRLSLIAQSKLSKAMFFTSAVDSSSSVIDTLTDDTYTELFQVPSNDSWQEDYRQWIQQATLNEWSFDSDFPQTFEASSINLQSLLYYQSNWLHPFLPQHTSNRLFTPSLSSQPILVPTMNKTASLLRFETEQAEIVVDPLQLGHQMMYILPKGNQALEDIDMESILQAYQTHQSLPLSTVQLSLPKMTLRSFLDVSSLIPRVYPEFSSLFERGNTNFKTPFSSMHIDRWSQTQAWTLDEQGFEVSSVSTPSQESSMVNGMSLFSLNRPFKIIVLNQDHMVLLSAMIENPILN